jgi:hypothetical protein
MATALSAPPAASSVAVFIDPVSHHFLGDGLFDVAQNRLAGDDILAPYAHLRTWFAERGVRVHTADRLLHGENVAERNVYISMGIQDNYRRLAGRRDVVLSAFFALECPIVEPALYRRLADAQRYFRRMYSFSDGDSLRPFLTAPLNCRPFHIPQSFAAVHEEIWRCENRDFLVMINANKLPRLYHRELYTERLRALEFFGRTGEIDLYGKGWDGPSRRVGKTWVPATVRRMTENLTRVWQRVRPDPILQAARRVYKGIAGSKSQTLGRYTFALCFENMILNGWITEKIFDCFFAGTVPVYWGAPDIERHVPADCFIDARRFAGYAELREYLRSLGPDDVRGYKERARAYLGSAAFHRFTKQAFADLFAEIVRADTGVSL